MDLFILLLMVIWSFNHGTIFSQTFNYVGFIY